MTIKERIYGIADLLLDAVIALYAHFFIKLK